MDGNTEEAMCSLQAQVHVQGLALRALVATHPDPAALLAEWRQILTDAGSGPVAVHERDSAYLAEHCRVRAEDWTAELVELTLPKLAADKVVVSGGGAVSLRDPEH
ncbi:hypothetical protein [Lysobacter tyrosinilyticus]